MTDHKLTPEAWVDANDEGFHDVILGRVRAVQCDRVLQELKRLAKERDEWQANAEAAEEECERRRDRAKSAERERDAHRAACEKAERDRDDALSGESWARAELESVAAAGWPELARLAEESERLRNQLADVEQRAEKAERERDEARAEFHKSNEQHCRHIASLEERAEKAERAAAAMREQLEAVLEMATDPSAGVGSSSVMRPGAKWWSIASVRAALASEAGREFLSRDQAREVARRVWGECSGSGADDGQVFGIDEVIDEVLRG